MAAVLCSSPSLFKNFSVGKPLSTGQKQIVLNVYARLRVLQPKQTITRLVNLCSELTGVSESTIFRLKADCKTHGAPSKPRRELFSAKRKRPKRIDKYDSFTVAAIRRKVHNFYRRNEPPTVKKVCLEINNDSELPDFKEDALRLLLIDMGFQYIKHKRDSALIDRDDLQIARRKYLRQIREYRSKGKTIYYLDETWINAGTSVDKQWTDTLIKSSSEAYKQNLTSGLKAPSGKGSRLIITHAGSDQGWVNGALDIFIGKKTGDYHEEMDGDYFENWFRTKLIPNINPESVIVMDNASYHSVRKEKLPTQKWKKAEIQAWLTSKGIQWTSDMIIKELLSVVAEVRHLYESYRIDTIAEECGHVILRLPPYHCELNPIELVWGHVKNRVRAENTTFKLNDVKVLADAAIGLETADMWNNSVQHVVKEEQRFWDLDNMTDVVMEKFIITVNTGDSDTSESDSDTSEQMGLDYMEEEK